MFRARICPASGARDYTCVRDKGSCSSSFPYPGRIACCPAPNRRPPATNALDTICGNNTSVLHGVASGERGGKLLKPRQSFRITLYIYPNTAHFPYNSITYTIYNSNLLNKFSINYCSDMFRPQFLPLRKIHNITSYVRHATLHRTSRGQTLNSVYAKNHKNFRPIHTSNF